MLRADRTAIGRRLAIGRASHGPPWRRRKPVHRPIVAPLTATLAASAAIGLGLTLARAGRERKMVRQRGRSRRLGVFAGEPRPPGSSGWPPSSSIWRSNSCRPVTEQGRGGGDPRDAQGAQAAAHDREGARAGARREGRRQETAALQDVAAQLSARTRRRGDARHARLAGRAPPAQARPPRACAGCAPAWSTSANVPARRRSGIPCAWRW